MDVIVLIVCIITGLLFGMLIGFGLLRIGFWRLYFRSLGLGMDISLTHLLHLYLARLPVERLHTAWVVLKDVGVVVSFEKVLEWHAARTNVEVVTNAYAAAKRGGLKVTFEQLRALDLSGGDPVEAVRRQLDHSIFYRDQRYEGIGIGDRGKCLTEAGLCGKAEFRGILARIVGESKPIAGNDEVEVVAVDGAILTVRSTGGTTRVGQPLVGAAPPAPRAVQSGVASADAQLEI